MSDGLDPRHGPYRVQQAPDFDRWCEEFMFSLIKAGLIKSGASTDKLEHEVKSFAGAVVKATKDGHFSEVT
jgi:hypothetical protein